MALQPLGDYLGESNNGIVAVTFQLLSMMTIKRPSLTKGLRFVSSDCRVLIWIPIGVEIFSFAFHDENDPSDMFS